MDFAQLVRRIYRVHLLRFLMKRICSEILRMLLATATLALLVEAVLFMQMRGKRAHVLEDWPDMMNLKADVVLIGDSRTAEHAIPELIEFGTGLAVYNIGYDGYDVQMGANRLEYFLEHAATPPEMVVLQTDLGYNRIGGGSKRFLMKDGVLRYFFLDQIGINDFFRSYENWREADEFIPLLRYKGYPLVFLKHLSGWDKWDRRDQKGFWHLHKASIDGPTRTAPPKKASITFGDIDSVCHVNGIELVCVIPPSLNSSLTPSDSIIKIVSSKQTVWDFSDLFTDNENFFYMDELHLNYEGARKYSKAMNLKLLEHLQKQ